MFSINRRRFMAYQTGLLKARGRRKGQNRFWPGAAGQRQKLMRKFCKSRVSWAVWFSTKCSQLCIACDMKLQSAVDCYDMERGCMVW